MCSSSGPGHPVKPPTICLMPQQAFDVDHHGQTIRGMIYRPEGSARVPTILFLHSFTGQRAESGFLFVQLARALMCRGMGVVTFDFLHSGESDGSFDQMLPTGELADVLHITQWLQGQPFVDRSRLGVLGFSLGGLLAACAAARINAYRAMVLVAPTTVENLDQYVQQRDDNGLIIIGSHKIHPSFLDDLRSLDPIHDITRHPCPTLVVHGTGDNIVPRDIVEIFIDAMLKTNVPTTLELIENANHNFTHPNWQRRLIDTVADWFQRYLA